MHKRPAALFALDGADLPLLFPPDLLSALSHLVRIDTARPVTDFEDADVRPRLPEVEILITGWGSPPITWHVLDALPRLRAILHTGGTVKNLLAAETWDRGILVSTAAAANGQAVVEYTLGTILLMGKNVFAAREEYRITHSMPRQPLRQDIGNLGRRVGIIGASTIGRRVIELLRPFDFEVLLHDPFLAESDARDPGVRPSGLNGLLSESAIVSIHAPATPETHHMIDGTRLALMPDGAVLINTARGTLVDTQALVKEPGRGRLRAVLDVTDPEPLPADSPLFHMPNAFLTPHIAGSLGNELRRLGASVLREAERLLAGHPLAHRVERAQLRHTA